MMEVEANGKTFTFPDGTNNAQIGEAIDSYFGGQPQPARQNQPMQDEFVPPSAKESKQKPNEIFDRIKKERSGFFGAGIIEPAMNLVSSAIAEPIALASGALDSINPFTDLGDSAQAANSVREMLTYDPRTDEGKAGMQSLSDVMNADLVGDVSIADVITPVIDMAGDSAAQTFDFLGLNPDFGRQVGRAMPDLVGAGLGAKSLTSSARAGKFATPVSSTGDAVSKAAINSTEAAKAVSKRITEQSPKNKIMADEIKNKGLNNDLARFKVNGKGKLIKDKVAISAIDAGLNEGTAQALKMASTLDRKKAAEMTRIRRHGKKNKTFESLNRPADVPGKTFLDRYNFVKVKNKVSGRKLDNVANSLKGENVDLSDTLNAFNSSMGKMGIRNDIDGNLDFSQSIIEGMDSQKAIESVVKRLKRDFVSKKSGAYDAHQMKKFLDETAINYGKDSGGLKGATENVFKQLRKNIDDSLDAKFERYNKVNTQFAETRKAMDSFGDVAGKKMNLSGKNAKTAVGQLLRRLDSNAMSRTPLGDSIDLVTETANKYGGKFTDDIRLQASYANQLDEIFGPVADTSLLGDLAKAGKRTAFESSTGRAPIGGAIDSAIAVKNKLLSKSDEKTFKAIMRMIND